MLGYLSPIIHEIGLQCCSNTIGLQYIRNNMPWHSNQFDLLSVRSMPLPCIRILPYITTGWQRRRHRSRTSLYSGLEGAQAANLTLGAHASDRWTIETPASENMSCTAVAFPSNLNPLRASILNGLNTFNELWTIENKHINPYRTSCDAGHSSRWM